MNRITLVVIRRMNLITTMIGVTVLLLFIIPISKSQERIFVLDKCIFSLDNPDIQITEIKGSDDKKSHKVMFGVTIDTKREIRKAQFYFEGDGYVFHLLIGHVNIKTFDLVELIGEEGVIKVGKREIEVGANYSVLHPYASYVLVFKIMYGDNEQLNSCVMIDYRAPPPST
ncbi:hypothetical protein EIN_462260 [Entamoeba invadens IP1]|uniref:Uncharacterized protein n=1 Tax=Entamoeba invadens IP1 TaxID=370355 RepID=A0A0A1U6F3_ENTIV|nr:hypothetical protein EIN_462260 [Entamoeba invadens IP1]ELP89880.1 hypothetical protein EIN_462260 [Entamoeba invadens IP1]|eukprot:XP_004256651.1 hypothetical protein EIN_462260 [Entamoeba invadens IP1]